MLVLLVVDLLVVLRDRELEAFFAPLEREVDPVLLRDAVGEDVRVAMVHKLPTSPISHRDNTRGNAERRPARALARRSRAGDLGSEAVVKRRQRRQRACRASLRLQPRPG
ncbi:hypothetical protein GCM10025786_35650 [Nocardioides caeni]